MKLELKNCALSLYHLTAFGLYIFLIGTLRMHLPVHSILNTIVRVFLVIVIFFDASDHFWKANEYSKHWTK